MNHYLKETKMLDYHSSNIQELIKDRKWNDMDTYSCIRSIYDFVRDEILFGYNKNDDISSSIVLKDGYGQCNTKGTLFMSLLRGCGIPCRMHAFFIDKKLQKGSMKGFVYKRAPNHILHSWVEVYFEERWYELEGFIIDKKYLSSLQSLFPTCTGSFCGYGIAVKDFQDPTIDFYKNDTYIQKEGIIKDLGIYDSPDDMLLEHQQSMNGMKRFLYQNVGRHLMNQNVRKIRNGHIN